jgi:hypothetical protein
VPRLTLAFQYHRTGMYTALELLDNKEDIKWAGQHSTPQHFRNIVLVGGGFSPYRNQLGGFDKRPLLANS